ncbi:MAG: hypothetical protein HOW97_05820 [Catenulispora sp.]|nr:hypothetical protein [Catenulispora sp.]NUR60043.1 hypothetical protein [Catenulispora sp.]
MTGLTLHVPGQMARHLEYLLLDVNGTLADWGVLPPGVPERLAAVNQTFDVLLLTADPDNNLPEIRAALGDIDVEMRHRLRRHRCAAHPAPDAAT